MSATTVSRPASPADVIVLQYANPTRLITIPLAILLAVVLVMVAVQVVLLREGGADQLDSGGALVWSLSGFIVATGVQAVAVVFPLALALGATRRAFTLGVLATSLLQAVGLTVASLLLLGLELATGGWFVGVRVLGSAVLGGGAPGLLVVTMLLASLAALAAGGLFGAAYVRFGGRGPMVLGIAITAAGVLAFLLLGPVVAAAARAFEPWWLVVAALVVVAIGTAGQHALLRRAAVR